MLPGLGLSGRYLLPAAATLAERCDVWVPDPPGFGASDGPPEALDIPALGDAIAAWMDVVGIGRAALVGNSMGCQTAVEIAVRHPSKVSHLVLEAPTVDASARSLRAQLPRVARDAIREPISLGPLQVRDWVAAGPRRLAATTGHMFRHRIEDRLGSVRCPTLVVRGSRDPIVPEEWAATVAAAAPGGSVNVVVGGTHAMPFSNPAVLTAVIARFTALEVARPGRSVPPDATGRRS